VQTADAEIQADLAVRAVGYVGRPLPGLPFEDGIAPDDGGRVTPGTYVVGWIKRGSTGGIGTNRTDAAETVGVLIEDVATGRLAPRPRRRTLLRR
jgi:ferredoxin--NADP+ reductase